MEFAEQKLYEIRQGKDATGLVKVDRAIFELYDKLQRISGDDKNSMSESQPVFRTGQFDDRA